MKSVKSSITGLALVCIVSWLASVASGCTAADTVGPGTKKGSSGAAGMSAGAGGSTGGMGVMTTGGAGSSVVAAGGNVGTGGDPSGGGGTPVTDASATGGAGGSAANDAAPPMSCPDLMACLKGALVHRYSFNGTGTAAMDTVGTAHGTVMNGTLSGNGDVALSAGSYVDLPNGLISPLTSVTLEIWVTWAGGVQGWQRVLDFGSSGGAEGTQSSATTTFYLTPQAGGPTVALAAFKRADQTYDQETRAQSAQPLAAGAMTQMAVVADPTAGTLTLYRDGGADGLAAFHDPLSMLNDVNNWIGRSQYMGDPAFTGTVHEFRIYNKALLAEVVQASFKAGPNATF